MLTAATYQVLIDQEFSEFEAFQEALENWTVDFHQLDRGRPLIRTILANCGEIQLGYTALNRRYQQRNRSPQGLLTFALLAEWTTDVNWGREKLDDRSLLLYPQDSEIVGVTGPGFQVFVITVSESVLIERAEKLGYLEATELLYDKGGHFRIPGTLLRRLRTGLFTESAPFLNSPSATPGVDEYTGRILDNLIVALASQYPAEFLERPQIKWVALKRGVST